MARPFDQYNPDKEFGWIDELQQNNYSPVIDPVTGQRVARGPAQRLAEQAINHTEFDLRRHRYQISEVIAYHQFMRVPPEQLEGMVKRKMAEAIGTTILTRVAELRSIERRDTNEVHYSAEFYALPPSLVRGDSLRFPQASSHMPPPVVQERVVEKRVETKVLPVEYANDELVEVWQIAYDMALSNPDDDVAPEKRALDAVLDHMREKI